MSEFFRKNRCGRDNWTGQRTAAGFVNPSNAREAGGTKFFLVTKSAAPVHPRQSSTDLREVTSEM